MTQGTSISDFDLPKRIIDIRGQKFGRLTVISYAGKCNTGSKWLCQCTCGNTTTVSRNHLITGTTKSCGCLHEEQLNQSIVTQCDFCGKEIRIKPYQFHRSSHHYCSKKCHALHKRETFSGVQNHQYGVKGPANSSFSELTLIKKNNHLQERMIYVGEWHIYSINGRVKEHRYLVEKNHHRYNPKYFRGIKGWFYLRHGVIVHHIDCNHNNNQIENLQPLTKEEHRRIHNQLTTLKNKHHDTK